jgi:hypothetical protein
MKQIMRELGVSAGSVWLWTHEIKLTEEQKSQIKARMEQAQRANWARGRAKKAEAFAVKKAQDVQAGIEMAKRANGLFIAGCMLYWAEGHTHRNHHGISFINSDKNMVLLFLLFLNRCLGVNAKNINWRVTCYTDIHSLNKILDYWRQGTGLSVTRMEKPMVNLRPSSSQGKMRKSEYGTCSVRIFDTSQFRRLMASIEETTRILMACGCSGNRRVHAE